MKGFRAVREIRGFHAVPKIKGFRAIREMRGFQTRRGMEGQTDSRHNCIEPISYLSVVAQYLKKSEIYRGKFTSRCSISYGN